MTAIYWPDFANFAYPFFMRRPQFFSRYRVHIWYGTTRIARLQSVEGRMMINSVVLAQCINLTDTQTATSP